MNREKLVALIEKGKTFVKSVKGKVIITAIAGVIVGFNLGGATAEQLSAVEELPKARVELIELQELNKSMEKELDELRIKVKEAEPFFKMEEDKRVAEAKKAEEERIKAEKEEEKREKIKKEEELKAKTKTLSNGNFISGEDFEAGRYDIVAVKGGGNVSSSNMYSGGINAIMGVANDGFYEKEYKNINLPDGVSLTIDGVTIKLVPRD